MFNHIKLNDLSFHHKPHHKQSYLKLKFFISVLISFLLCILIQYISMLSSSNEPRYSTISHFHLRFSEVKVKDEYNSLLLRQHRQLIRKIDLKLSSYKKKYFKKGYYYTYPKWFLIVIDIINISQLFIILFSYFFDFFGIIKFVTSIYEFGNVVCFATRNNLFRSISYIISLICRIGYLIQS